MPKSHFSIIFYLTIIILMTIINKCNLRERVKTAHVSSAGSGMSVKAGAKACMRERSGNDSFLEKPYGKGSIRKESGYR